MRVKKRLSIPLLISALLIGYTLFEPPAQLSQDSMELTPPTSGPDSIADTVSLLQFDEAGVVLDQTNASQLRRFDKAALIELDELRRHGHAGDTNWTATADGGLLVETNNELQLEGNVQLRYEADDLQFRSAAMTIDLDKQIARSRSAVRVWQARNETTADALTVDLAKEQASMLGNVRAVYAPEG